MLGSHEYTFTAVFIWREDTSTSLTLPKYNVPSFVHVDRCYSSAADDGHADASYCLGVMQYAMGNMQEAFRCYQTAAEGGNVLAWRNLASMHALGEGVPRSEQMAKNIISTFGDEIKRQEKEQEEDEKER